MSKWRGTLVRGWALGLALAAFTAGGTAEAAKPEAKTKAAVVTAPASAKVAITVTPAKIAWGMSHKQVAEIYDKVLDEEFKPKFKSVSAGLKLKMLESELAEAKSEFRRSRIDFGKTPTGLDSTPLRPEYSYLNKESALVSTHGGKTRYYFFIQDKLWKIVDEVKNVASEGLGKTYAEAVAALGKKYGVPGRNLEADGSARLSNEVDWKDQNTHLRVVERGEASLALIYEDWATAQNIASLRTNKPTDHSEIDPVVAGVTRKEPPAPPAPPAPETKGKGKK